MTARIASLLSRWGPPLLAMAGILYFSSRPHPLAFLPASRRGPAADYLAHFGEYAILSALLYRGLARRGAAPTVEHPAPVTFGVAFAFAVSDELHQMFVPGRGFDLADLAVDAVAMLLTLALIYLAQHLFSSPLRR